MCTLQGEKNLVYAELMLKPSSGGNGGSAEGGVAGAGVANEKGKKTPESTEYAEILYVAKDGTQKQQPPPLDSAQKDKQKEITERPI